MTDFTNLTGAQVRELREGRYHLSRAQLAELCGYPTQTRISNIEFKDSWKEGDREKIAAAFQRAEQGDLPKKGHKGRRAGETGDERAARLQAALKANGKALVNDTDEPPMFDPHTMGDDLNPDGADWLIVSEPIGDAVQDTSQHPRQLTPPPGWFHLGTHVDTPGKLDFSDETDEAGLPLWERPAVVQPEVIHVGKDVFDNIKLIDGKLLSNSEVAVWQRCRRKWWLAIYRKLEFGRRDYTNAREIGNRVHRALAGWYVPEGHERVDPRDALERAIVEDWTAIVTQARKFGIPGDEDQALAEMSVKFQEAVSLERAMVEGYVEWMEERGEDANLEVIAPESILTAKLEGEVAGEHVEVTALGKIDVRLRRKSDGVRLFEDHKTVGNFTEPRKMLHMDPQMLHYHLLEFLNSDEGDERCDGALYNMLRKVKRTAKANPPFYDRIEVRHNPHEIDAYRRRLLGAARDIDRTTRELDEGADPMSVAYPNPTRNCSWDCDFFSICPMFDDGSRVEDAITALYHVGDPLARYSKDQETGI